MIGTIDHETLTRALQLLMPEWRMENVRRFEYLSGGYSNENYRFSYGDNDYVLRVPSREHPYVDRTLELGFYSNRHRVPTPLLVSFDVSSGLMLTEFEQGPLLVDAAQTTADLVSYLHRTHSALPSSNRTYDPLELSRRFLSTGSVPAWINRLNHRIWVPPQTTPCHNDLNPWNVIVSTPERWVTLDWEWFGDNDPLFDLITLHQGLEMSDLSLLEMIQLWREQPVDNQRIENCLIAYWLREYAWAHAEQHHGNCRPEIDGQIARAADRLRVLTT